MQLYEVLANSVSDRDPRFASRFWGILQKATGTILNFSPVFHPHSDGQLKRIIQTVEGMLRLMFWTVKEIGMNIYLLLSLATVIVSIRR